MTLYRDLRESGAQQTRPLVDVERTGDGAFVTLNDPERLNPLSAGLNLQLLERLSELAADHELRAIVITGGGSRVLDRRRSGDDRNGEPDDPRRG